MLLKLRAGPFRVLLVFMLGFFTRPALADITVGKPAPEFKLYDQQGQIHSLADYAGRWVALYFYPKDDTPGCTIEACRFRDDLVKIRSLNAEVLGISLDSTGNHARFAARHDLQFPLLSDPEGRIAELYGCLLSMGPLKLARRHTFLVDTHGKIARIFRSVDPRTHSAEVIAALEELQSKRAGSDNK
jgi:peroxiredoxin Q/BCP